MKTIGKVFGTLAGGLIGGPLVKAVFGGKKKKPVQPLPQATRDDAQALADQEDELRRRKGGAADILTGTMGAEAALSGGRLVIGS
jgi:hypothetical protein